MDNNKIKGFDITNPQKIEEIKEVLKEIIDFDDFELAFNISNGLKWFIENTSNFKSQQADLYRRYRKIIIKMRWIALHLLTDKEVVNLFRESFVDTYDIDFYDLQEKFRRKMLSIFVLKERDILKKKVQVALLKNKQLLTKKYLTLHGKKAEPTVANWLVDYSRNLGTGPVNKTRQVEYLVKKFSELQLVDEERNRLKILFKFFESLKYSSLSAPGMEERIPVDDDGRKGILASDKFEPLKDENKVKKEIKDAIGVMLKSDLPDFINKSLKQQYDRLEINKPEVTVDQGIIENQRSVTASSEDEGGKVDERGLSTRATLQKLFNDFLTSELMMSVFERVEEVKGEVGKDIKKLRNKFYHAVNVGNKEGALAVMMVAAESKRLGQMFGGDERFVKFWKDYLLKHQAEIRNKKSEVGKIKDIKSIDDIGNIKFAVERFENDPANGKDLAMFFKYILEDRLKIKKEEAVMWGMVLSNLARQASDLEYQEMVYGDLETGRFEWNIN